MAQCKVISIYIFIFFTNGDDGIYYSTRMLCNYIFVLLLLIFMKIFLIED